ncbi:MAG: hypothetical protein FWG66_00085, partial [Spirochaetes bacterium]|nr:hypothetical protein [Spirochaetota bacterium]
HYLKHNLRVFTTLTEFSMIIRQGRALRLKQAAALAGYACGRRRSLGLFGQGRPGRIFAKGLLRCVSTGDPVEKARLKKTQVHWSIMRHKI